MECCGEADAEIVVRNMPLRLRVIVLDRLISGIDVVLGLDAIDRLGGAIIAKGQVKFGNQSAPGVTGSVTRGDTNQPSKPRPCLIEDDDFRACFDGEKWMVEWRWTAEPPVLTNQVSCYKSTLKGAAEPQFEKEVERWIDEGILMPWSGKVEGILPLMAVEQPIKKKVRPVLDFWELNN